MLHKQKEVEDDTQLNDTLATARVPNFIAIEGPIGVGKTTLARRLAETFGKQLLLEPSFENPFLESFYSNGSKFALPTQLYFLLNRARQLAEIPQPGILERQLVSDFLFEKDRLFAELTLNKEELKLYDEITLNLSLNIPKPNLVIYLQAPTSVLIDRIRDRGVLVEKNIKENYLGGLSESYSKFFLYYDSAPVLTVNSTFSDFISNQEHYDGLVEQILSMRGSHQFFSPNPSLLDY
ncbi:MAG: deoxynucleoside kinase [Pseudomonadota bacterium]|nr:deoxynucleoside kinase [Pseudomonadota bacterium]